MRKLRRVAVLWGGGLGDLLVVRPLLRALASHCEEAPVFMTRTGRFAEVLDAFGLGVPLLRLDDSPWRALRQVRAAGKFDLAYIGPHASRKTRVLSHTLKARRVWARRAGDAPDRFIADVICDDVLRLGLAETAPPPYGGVPIFADALESGRGKAPVVLHTGTKRQWETTRWPAERWRELIRRLLDFGDSPLVIVGASSEAEEIQTLLADITAPEERLTVELGLSFPALEERIACARAVVCHNSGIMHLAAAWQKPTVVVTGSSARYWRPGYPWVRNVTSGACELACNRYRCPVPGYRAKCINELGVERVWAVVAPLLE